jgi:hypothetical protein
MGWSRNFVGSESAQIQSVKFFKNMVCKRTPYSPLTYCIHTVSQGRGGELNQRDGERGKKGEYRSQSLFENTNMTECTQEIGYLQSIDSDKHLPQCPFKGQLFRQRHFALTSISLIFLRVQAACILHKYRGLFYNIAIKC